VLAGTSVTTPRTNEATPPPTPGNELIAPGVPLGGFAAGCGGPATATCVVD